MKPCRWCGQPIEPSAQRCHHCRTWQRDGADHEEVRAAQILDKGFLYWGKFLAGLLSVALILALAVGGFDLRNASQQAWQAQVAAQASQADAEGAARAVKNEAERISLDANKVLEDAKAKLKELTQLVDNQDQLLTQQRADFEQQIELITGEARSVQSGNSLINLGAAISVLQKQISALEKKVADSEAELATQVKAEPLSDEEWKQLDQILRIEQTAKKVDPGGAGTRQSYDVTFRLCSFVDGACGNDSLSKVYRVVYRFDPGWFSVADVPVLSTFNQFGYTLRVWGVTRVRACIFLVGAPDRPIIRAGTMSLADEPSYWGQDPSAKPDDCAGLKNI